MKRAPRRRSLRWACLLAIAWTVSCRSQRPSKIEPEEADDTPPQSNLESQAPPERRPHSATDADAPSGVFTLAVEGFEPALVSLPARRMRREPILVAVHGAGDGPEWECAVWREIVGERGVILCPAGRPLDRDGSGHFHPNHHELERLLLASMEALVRAIPERIDAAGPAVYAAYSQGATMGALMIVRHAERFSRLVLVEGGYSEWNVARGRAFKKAGGQRVLFACGTRHCGTKAQRSATWLDRAGISTRVIVEPTGGHTYGGVVGRRVAEFFDWVVEGDSRWQEAE